MRKPSIAQAATASTDLRQRAAGARDTAGRFIKRAAPAEPQTTEAVEPDPAIAVATVFRASWDALGQVLNAEVPDELSQPLSDAQNVAYGELRAVRPTTPAGYRALAECWSIMLKGERGDEEGITLADDAADSLIAGSGVCVPSPPLAGTDGLVLSLIEEHRAAFAEWDRLSAVWNEMMPGVPGYAEAMAASEEPGSREVAAYDALFTARPTSLAGAAALASYLGEAVRRTRIDAEPSDGERALGAVAAALRRLTPSATAPTETGIPVTAAAAAGATLINLLDLAAASMVELLTVRDLADRVGSVAYAAAWSPRCHRRVNAYGAHDYNDAGKLMQWLGDALTDVETAVDKEVASRAPSNRLDREPRLLMLAARTIENGDPDAIKAFAIELLDHASAESRGH